MSIYYKPELRHRLAHLPGGSLTVVEFFTLVPEVRLFMAGDKIKERTVLEAGEIFLGGRVCHQMVTYDLGNGKKRIAMEVVAIFGEPPSTIEGFEKACRKLDGALDFYLNALNNPDEIMDPATFEIMKPEAREDYYKTCRNTIARLKAEVEEAAERLPPGPVSRLE